MSMFRGRRAPLKGMGRAAVYWGARWVSGHTIPLITQLLFLFILDLVYFVFLRGAGRSLRLGMGNSYDTYCTYAQQIMITAMPWDTSFVTSVTNLFGTFVSQMTFRPWNERKCHEPIQASQIQPTPQKVECVCLWRQIGLSKHSQLFRMKRVELFISQFLLHCKALDMLLNCKTTSLFSIMSRFLLNVTFKVNFWKKHVYCIYMTILFLKWFYWN